MRKKLARVRRVRPSMATALRRWRMMRAASAAGSVAASSSTTGAQAGCMGRPAADRPFGFAVASATPCIARHGTCAGLSKLARPYRGNTPALGHQYAGVATDPGTPAVAARVHRRSAAADGTGRRARRLMHQDGDLVIGEGRQLIESGHPVLHARPVVAVQDTAPLLQGRPHRL